MTRLFDMVRLNLTGCVGAQRFRKLQEACPDTESIFKLSPASVAQICNTGPRTAKKILEPKYSGWAASELNAVLKKGYRLISLGDDGYPALLAEAPDPPLVLYVRGSVSVLDTISIAIVGTRRCSRYGKEMARRFAGELAALGITIVSGLALGIDGEAHRGALEAQGKTVAVVGTGVDQVYPGEHYKLAHQVEQSGAIVTEFPLGTKPRKENFPRRNRVISGLSRGVLVVEAPKRSGALITARTALEQGREVFAVPGRADYESASGCHSLIKDGAKLTESIRDILEEIAPQLAERAVPASDTPEKAQPAHLLTEGEQTVYQLIEKDPVSQDTIIAESGLGATEVAAALLKLQLKQLIEQLPGNRYARK